MTENLMITWLTGGRAKSKPKAPNFFHQNTHHRIHRHSNTSEDYRLLAWARHSKGFYKFTHFNLTTIHEVSTIITHNTDEEIEAQRRYVTCSPSKL